MEISEDTFTEVITAMELEIEYYKESAALWRLSFIDAVRNIRKLEKIISNQDLLDGEVIY